jgi:hypothetical protein
MTLPANIEQLLKDLQHNDPIRRKMTAKTLAKYGSGYEMVISELRCVAQTDPEREVRSMALDSLKALGDGEFADTVVLPEPPPVKRGEANQPELDFDPDAKSILPAFSFMPEMPSRLALYGGLGLFSFILFLVGDFIATFEATESLLKAASLLCAGAGGVLVLACVVLAGAFIFANRAELDLRDIGMVGVILGTAVFIGVITAFTAYALWTTHSVGVPTDFYNFEG